jgi:hypothetical protein
LPPYRAAVKVTGEGSELASVREIDVNAVREPTIALHNLKRTDDVYTFYYDETNNIRRLQITADGFNVKDPMCFVLGGVAHRGPPHVLDIAGLKKAVRLQAPAKELKLTHLGNRAISRPPRIVAARGLPGLAQGGRPAPALFRS